MPRNVCPVSNVTYCGDCPIQSCPASLHTLSGGRKQGCYFLHAKDTDIPTVCKVLGITVEEGQQLYESGMSTMNHITGLIELANVEAPFCKYCGFPSDEGDCLDEERCDRHTGMIDLCLKKSPFNIPAFKFTKEGIWRIAVGRHNAGCLPSRMREYVRFIREEEGYVPPEQIHRFLHR